MNNQLKIGMIGLDTSHCPAFTELLNTESHQHHVKGGKVEIAFPGGSPDFELSSSRVDKITKQLAEDFNVKIVNCPEEVAENSDVILLTSVDGRVHLNQFEKISSYKKPVYIDKPLAVTSEDARQIYEIANKNGIPIMSSSSLRYTEELQNAIEESCTNIIGADTFGPMKIEPTQPGLFWYGIHAVEMLYAVMGQGCKSVQVTSADDHDFVVGHWKDGRVGTVRGNRAGNNKFGALIHRDISTTFVDAQKGSKPHYASLLERIMKMFKTGKPDVTGEETIEIIRFIEAANESRETGQKVALELG